MKPSSWRDNAIVLSTYPKCGTNWVACILWLILHPDEGKPSVEKILKDIVSVDASELREYAKGSDNGPRIFGTHLSSDRVQMDSETKYITIVRNPFDCCVSYYHFMRGVRSIDLPTEGNIVHNNFFEWFLNGEVPYGDFFEHVKSWYNCRQNENVLFLTYEDLKKDHKGGVLRISRFLGLEEQLMTDGGKLLHKIVRQSSFNYMKKHLIYELPNEEGSSQIMPMLRKGKVGGFKNALTPEQVKRLGRKMESELAGTELLTKWRQL